MQRKRRNYLLRAAATAALLGASVLGASSATAAERRESAEHRQDVEARDAHGRSATVAEEQAAPQRAEERTAPPQEQDLKSPQPASTADFSGHGANEHGTYDSTRDGSPSANGNGDGAAVGQPCAGCVGRADNKNPLGQWPDGTDANAGYECEVNRNRGIGRTNPAHTGCVVAAKSNPPVRAALTSPAEVLSAVFAPPAVVLGNTLVAAVLATPVVSSSAPPLQSTPAALARTGSHFSALLVIAIALLAVGMALTLQRRQVWSVSPDRRRGHRRR